MVEIVLALKRPLKDFKKLLIAILLCWLPIINFWTIGYFFECAKSAMKKKFELPEWKNWSQLWVNGLLGSIILIIYCIPILIVIAIAIVIVLSLKLFSTGASTLTGTGTIVVAILIFLVLLLFFVIFAVFYGYISPMAIMHFINKNKFGDAFNFKLIFKRAFTQSYLIAWLIILAYSIVGSTVLQIIYRLISLPSIVMGSGTIPLIWTGFAFLIYFILSIIYSGFMGITSYTLYGDAFGEVVKKK